MYTVHSAGSFVVKLLELKGCIQQDKTKFQSLFFDFLFLFSRNLYFSFLMTSYTHERISFARTIITILSFSGSVFQICFFRINLFNSHTKPNINSRTGLPGWNPAMWYHLNGSFWAVLFCGIVHYIQDQLNKRRRWF